MPTYEYVCKECGEHLEVVQSFNDDTLTVCPSCHGELKKVFGNIGIVFKGAGFYKTDSRSGSKTAATAGKADSSTKSETSSDSAPKSESPAKSESSTKPESKAKPEGSSPSPSPSPAPATKSAAAS
ncbi:MAG: FmdB family zinc ribbon protein [Acidimicrobiales bacterium]